MLRKVKVVDKTVYNMYNPQKVLDLLKTRCVSQKELLDYMGKNWNGSIKGIITGDIRVSKLEKIADFFGVPVDEFFDREQSVNGVLVGGVRNNVHHFSVKADPAALQALIDEKDKRIKLLEDMVALLKGEKTE